jgi:uridine monophosphate synthetase
MKGKLDDLHDLALELFKIGAVKCEGYYKLKLHEQNPKAPLSPIFLNLRTADNPKPGLLTPKIVADIANIFYAYVMENGIVFDFIVGIPNAADPFVKAFAALIPGGEEKILYLEKETEAEMRKIGKLKDESKAKIFPGAIALLFDDLITKAESKLEAAHSLEDAGLNVQDIIVLVDREQGGKQELEKEGYVLHAMTQLSKLLDLYFCEELINEEKFNEICLYLDSNS